MKSVLITGINGMLGSALEKYFYEIALASKSIQRRQGDFNHKAHPQNSITAI